MGSTLSFDISCKHHYKVLVLGLEHSGKTSICMRICERASNEKLYLGKDPSPTVTLHQYNCTVKGEDICLTDIGGKPRMMNNWKDHFKATDALIWVVDISESLDDNGMEKIKSSIDKLVQCLVTKDENGTLLLKNKPIVIMQNKADSYRVKLITKGFVPQNNHNNVPCPTEIELSRSITSAFLNSKYWNENNHVHHQNLLFTYTSGITGGGTIEGLEFIITRLANIGY